MWKSAFSGEIKTSGPSLVRGFGCDELVLYGIRDTGVATLWSSRPMRAEPRWTSTNESGPHCFWLYLVSLNGEGQEGEDTDADGEGGGEGVDAAVKWAKYPLSVIQGIIINSI